MNDIRIVLKMPQTQAPSPPVPSDGGQRARRLVARGKLSWKIYGLLQPDCPAEFLGQYGRYPQWQVRLVVALHPSTPALVRLQLARDPVEQVRVAAQYLSGLPVR